MLYMEAIIEFITAGQ